MTIKLPEPVATVDCKEVHGHTCQFINRTRFGMDTLRNGDDLYTEAQLKKAIKDALEDAAKVCNGVADLSVAHQGVSQGSTYSNQCADEIRKLKDQL